MILTVALMLCLFSASCQKSTTAPAPSPTPVKVDFEKPKNDLPPLVERQQQDTFPQYDNNVIYNSMEQSRQKRWPHLAKRLRIEPGMAVGDIGCGSGMYTFMLADLAGPQGKVYALDIQEKVLDILRKKMENKTVYRYGNIEVIQNRVDDAMLPEGTLDLGVMVNLHFHSYEKLLPESQRMLASVYRAIRPGGRLVIEDGNDALPAEAAQYVLQHYREAGFQLESGPDYVDPEAGPEAAPQEKPVTFYLTFIRPE